MEATFNKHKLIDDKRRSLMNRMLEVNLPSTDRLIIGGILGTQNTGKSTLLNKLFGTKFEVRNRARPREPVTVGIDVSISNKYMILDVEGSDSPKRPDYTTELVFGTFSCLVCRFLIININYKQFDSRSYIEFFKVIIANSFKFGLSGRRLCLIFVIKDLARDDEFQTYSQDAIKLFSEIWYDVTGEKYSQETFPIYTFNVKYIEKEETLNHEDVLALRNHLETLHQDFSAFIDLKSLLEGWDKIYQEIVKQTVTIDNLFNVWQFEQLRSRMYSLKLAVEIKYNDKLFVIKNSRSEIQQELAEIDKELECFNTEELREKKDNFKKEIEEYLIRWYSTQFDLRCENLIKDVRARFNPETYQIKCSTTEALRLETAVIDEKLKCFSDQDFQDKKRKLKTKNMKYLLRWYLARFKSRRNFIREEIEARYGFQNFRVQHGKEEAISHELAVINEKFIYFSDKYFESKKTKFKLRIEAFLSRRIDEMHTSRWNLPNTCTKLLVAYLAGTFLLGKLVFNSVKYGVMIVFKAKSYTQYALKMVRSYTFKMTEIKKHLKSHSYLLTTFISGINSYLPTWTRHLIRTY